MNKKHLLAGKHVWSEKPMANTCSEGKALFDLAKSENSVSGEHRQWSTALLIS
ncbi:MAG: Gfo/Idh/MocA family oxidoreductase [Chitinophagaceae bacterium]|nr:Gfo/Idh/MocA family oxidoreductase [Chitinophagaceae bacterium]